MIRTLEELAINGWPAIHTAFYDGWILRAAEGYTRRANSVAPLYPSSVPLHDKLLQCESFYREFGLPAIFKLTTAALPSNLDTALADRGYELQAPTSVCTLSLANLITPPPVNLYASPALSDRWLEAFCRLGSVDAGRRAAAAGILSQIEGLFAGILQDDALVAVGLAVRDREFIGLCDIVTAAGLRRQGLGAALVQSLLHWGKQNGAATAWLQVMGDNLPAQRLYDRLGFREAYQYWYRVQPKHFVTSGHPEVLAP